MLNVHVWCTLVQCTKHECRMIYTIDFYVIQLQNCRIVVASDITDINTQRLKLKVSRELGGNLKKDEDCQKMQPENTN